MDETTSLIYFGCNLAKILEAMLPGFGNQPDILSRKCDEIVMIFSDVKKRLSYGKVIFDKCNVASLQQEQEQEMNGLMQELSRTRNYLDVHESEKKGIEPEECRLEMFIGENGGGGLEAALKRQWGDDGGQRREMCEFDSSRGLSSHRQKIRRVDDDKITMRVDAPRMGNTEIPPEDGHTWRKYGQKDILGSKFPRAYYRCTHQKLYKCPAKKQVQRLDNDPYVFEVTYRGQHACLVSFTTPSPPLTTTTTTKFGQVIALQGTKMSPSQPFNSFPSSYWISMDIKSLEEDMQQMHRDFANTTNILYSSSTSSGNSSTELVPVKDFR